MKSYTLKDVKTKWTSNSKKCIECNEGSLIKTRSENNGWVDIFNCDKCSLEYKFTHSDMGQTKFSLTSNAK